MVCRFVQAVSMILEFLLSKLYFINNDGFRVLDEGWDYLIIIDACRFDAFLEAYKKRKMRGKLEYRVSRGASTVEFLKENFSRDKFYRDIVYVTANPFVNKLFRKNFYKIIPVWKTDWCEKKSTVLASSVYKHAVFAAHKYRGKKLIIHFMQPHFPYVNYDVKDESMKQLREHILNNKAGDIWIKIDDCRNKIRPLLKVFHQGFFLELSPKELKKYYMDNLHYVLDYVEKLVDILPGKVVVTSDHGEAFGEKVSKILPIRVYGHLVGIRIPSLVIVPWLEVENKEDYKKLEREYLKLKIKKVRRRSSKRHITKISQ
ncbi:MAG: hypothetical protein ACP6IP_05805 [Candidatus Njordarchaeia archaeon]